MVDLQELNASMWGIVPSPTPVISIIQKTEATSHNHKFKASINLTNLIFKAILEGEQYKPTGETLPNTC